MSWLSKWWEEVAEHTVKTALRKELDQLKPQLVALLVKEGVPDVVAEPAVTKIVEFMKDKWLD